MSNTVYLILNETTYLGTEQVTTEVVEATLDLQWAMDWLQELAAENEIYVADDADSVVLQGRHGTGVDVDEYYIAEMELRNG